MVLRYHPTQWCQESQPPLTSQPQLVISSVFGFNYVIMLNLHTAVRFVNLYLIFMGKTLVQLLRLGTLDFSIEFKQTHGCINQ